MIHQNSFSLLVGLLLLATVIRAQTPILLKDIYPSFGAGYLQLNNVLYFQADDGLQGKELWRTDGTANGTYLVKDLNPGGRTASSSPSNFFDFKGILYFKAYVNGNWRLCKSDGTAAGTVSVNDQTALNIYWMGSYQDKLYFLANIDQLWTSDGTAAGTTLVKGFNTSNGVIGAAVGKDNLYFTVDAYFSGSDALWKSNGTAAGTVIVKEFPTVGDLAITANGTIFLSADDGTYGKELWKSDGTSAGTTLVKNIRSRGESSGPYNLFAYKNTVFFNAYEDTNPFSSGQLWRSDGTETGTVRVKNSRNEAFPSMCAFEQINDRLVMLERRAYTNKTLYISDGSDQSIKSLGWFMALEGTFSNQVAGTRYPKTPDGEICYFDLQSSSRGNGLIKYAPKDTVTQQIATLPSDKYPTEGFAMAGRAFVFNLNGDYGLYKYDVCAHSAKINTTNGISFCPGSSVAITAEGSGGTGGYTYKWKSGTSDVGTNASLSVTKAGTYLVEITNQSCTVSTSVDIKETTNLPVSVLGSSTLCAGTATPLSATVSGGVTPYTYQWQQAGSNVAGATSSTLSVTATGVYSISATDSKGCTGTSSAFVVTAKAAPTASITTATTSLTSGASTVLVTPAASGQTYQWYVDSQPISGATNNTYTTNQKGTFTVMVTRDGCSATSQPTTINLVLATEPTLTSLGLDVSPNPVLQNAEVRLNMVRPASATFVLVDATGKVIGEWKAPQSRLVHELTLPMKTQPTGVYFLRVESNGLQAVRRILKQ